MSASAGSSYRAETLGSFWVRLKAAAAALALCLAAAACSSTDTLPQAIQGYQPCGPADLRTASPRPCDTGRNVLMAMATGQAVAPEEVVETKVLEEQRGGFITAGGLSIDFGFEFSTLVNGVPQLNSVLTLNDILSGQAGAPTINGVTINGTAGGLTQIIHAAGPDGINATILNSQDGVQIENISTLSIDIIGLERIHQGGRALGNGRRMPIELQQSIIRGLAH